MTGNEDNDAAIESSPRQAAGNLHRKDEDRFPVRSLTPPQAAGNALAIAVQHLDRIKCHTGDPEKESIPMAAYQRCQKWVAQGRLNEGIACLERLTLQHPEFALAHNDLGVLYYQQGDKARCVSSYQKAVEMDPRNPVFKKNLADFCLVEEESMEKALEIYASVLNDNPEDIDALMVAGHICSMLGNNDSARTFYERILDIEPWNFDAGEGIEKLSGRQLPKSNSSNDINLLPAN
jgi:tetratricopeptide (TPR) repeat protein